MPNHNNRWSRRNILKLLGAGGVATLAGTAGLPFGRAFAQDAPPAEDITATLDIFDFGGDPVKKAYGEAIARFNTRYPNVTVNDNYFPVVNGDWAQYINQFRTRIASGLNTDILAMAIEGARLTIVQNLVLPIDDFIAEDPEAQTILEDIHPVLHDALKYQDTTYYMTREWNNMIIHYNTQLFEEAGLERPATDWTWDDFLETAQALTKGEGSNKVYGFGIPFFNFGLTPWWYTNGTSILTPDWSASNLDDPKMLESVKFVHALVHEHGVSPSVEGADPYNLFSAGRVAMTAGGRWPLETYLAGDFTTMDIQNWPRKESGTTVFGSGGWAISKSSQNAALAWELIKELSAFETNAAIAGIGAAIPAMESATQIDAYQALPEHADLFYASLQDAQPVPAPANFTEVQAIFMRHMTSILSNAVTPEQGLEMAHQELSQAMSQLTA